MKIIALALLLSSFTAITNAAEQAQSATLSPLLVRTNGKAITSERDWLEQKEILRKQWLDVLGGFPKVKSPLKAEILATEQLDGFTRQYVKYQIFDGEFIDGYLLSHTNNSGKSPAVVVFHPTTTFQAKGVAGLVAEYPEDKWQGVQLARRGYVVWCPRNYINTDGEDWKGNAHRVLLQHSGWTGMTRMVWDAIRAVDFLESLPNVDRNRIGCLGHSLGGKEVLYAMAFDGRYRAGVSSEGGIGLRFSNWDADWYLGEQINSPDFRHENHEVLSLIAPRAFLLLAGNSADGEKSEEFLDAVRPVYQLSGATERLRIFNHGLGHNYPPAARREAEEFLERYLKP